jgi:hypothetical protein
MGKDPIYLYDVLYETTMLLVVMLQRLALGYRVINQGTSPYIATYSLHCTNRKCYNKEIQIHMTWDG